MTEVAMQPARASNHGPVFVVFGGSAPTAAYRWWWRPFRRPGFEHCFALIPMAQGSVLVNGQPHGLTVEWSDQAAADCVAAWVRQFPRSRVLMLVDRDTGPVYAPLEPMTCVTAVKAALGLRAPWVFSPRGLHRELLRRGAQRING